MNDDLGKNTDSVTRYEGDDEFDEFDDDVARSTHCALPEVQPRDFGPGFDPGREAAIIVSDKKWTNGTHLRYHFLGEPEFPADKEVVRAAFRQWEELPVGLKFSEVDDRTESEIRITFDWSEGSSWSKLGRDCLGVPSTVATMNFGWRLSGWGYGRDTALHEIGHAMGLPHEHQNPTAGIVWDEPAVIANFAGPPNEWSPSTTYWNILRKIPADDVQGSSWDVDSIMHYQFEQGLITVPDKYQTEPLIPAPNLSARDVEWIQKFYPPGPDDDLLLLEPFRSQSFDLAPAEQANFVVEPPDTRWYEFSTFGASDTVMVLFDDVTTGPEDLQGLRFREGDDDSGTDLNARFGAKLFKGSRYVLRVRLYWPAGTGRVAVMMW